MTAAALSFTPRERNIKVWTQLINRERLADDVHISEPIQQLPQVAGLDSVNFQVPVLRLLAHQLIPHTTADEQRASAGIANGSGKIQNVLRRLHAHSIKAGNAGV